MRNLTKLENIKQLIIDFTNHSCFDDVTLYPENAFQRPIRKQDLTQLDYTKGVKINELSSNKNLILNKLLLTVNEQDLLFLTETFKSNATKILFENFYDSSFVSKGKCLKPMLEKLVFGFLEEEIKIVGAWDKEKLQSYCLEIIEMQTKQVSELCQHILTSKNQHQACKMLLIQMASDFLSEASAMAKTLPGSYGKEQSELMKVFIDEYGYGVYPAKHSTLFEKTLLSADLNQNIHYYYNAYLPTSLMLVNYFHYICSNKQLWFRYLGALFYTEASIPHFNQQLSSLIKKLLPDINTDYFDEHVHIDNHHQKMVMNDLILSSIDKYGTDIIPEILLGFESFRLLQSLADKDLMEQIKFNDQLTTALKYKSVADGVTFTEKKGEISSAHIHEEHELFHVLEGKLKFYNNGMNAATLSKGEEIIIPKGRVHATEIISDTATYYVTPVILSGD